MLDIKLIRQNSEAVKKALKKREAEVDIDYLLKLDKKKREKLQLVEDLRAEKNKISSQAQKNPQLIEKAKEIKENLKKEETELRGMNMEFEKIFLPLPNIPLDDVPRGKNEKDNIVLRQKGKIPKFNFKLKDHLDLGQELDLIDTGGAAKISGARFGILKNEAVLLELALLNFAFDFLLKHNFVPVLPPALIKKETMQAMGYVDTAEDLEERYYLEKDGLFLAGTAEQSIGAIHREEMFAEKDLPKRYAAFSPCFREEAGSYGKDTRGIFRVHQFDKLEMFSFAKPEDSREEHNFLLAIAEKLMEELELPYRVMHLCTGEMSHPSASTFDIETWFPCQGKYRETHSISNCTDFQARRLNTKYLNPDNNAPEFVHTLNATAFAMGRIIIAIMENYQQKDGKILMPKALKKYLSFEYIPQKHGRKNNND